jgi:DNA-binding NarL/FixJ family response regulator
MHTVLVAYQNEVFARGVMGFLKDVPGIKVASVTSDLAEAVEAARSLRADVVILEAQAQDHGARVHTFLRNPSTRRVVTISLDSLVATVYEARELPMAGASALLSAIRGEGVPATAIH